MSSKPNTAAKGGKGQPGGPAKDKESKAVKGPVVTPQALGVVFGILLLGGFIFIMNNGKKQQEEIAGIKGQIATQETQIKTYMAKGKKKDEADKLNKALKEKLSTLDYLFLEDQSSLVPFYESTFFPLLDGSNLVPGSDASIKVSEYVFRMNMAMRPVETLPPSSLFDDAADAFKISYTPEQNGTPWETPLDTRPTAFLQPYDIKMEGFVGTYNDVKQFIKDVQSRGTEKLITVHCLKNDEGKLAGLLRTTTEWTINMTVYFINPEQPANGDAPPSPPGAKSC